MTTETIERNARRNPVARGPAVLRRPGGRRLDGVIGPDSDRVRRGLVRGPDRRLAPAARRRGLGGGERLRQADRARHAGVSYALGLLPIDPRVVLALRSIDGAVLKRPVGLGDTIRVRARLADKRELGAETGLVTLAVRIVNQADELVARMEIVVLWRRRDPRRSPTRRRRRRRTARDRGRRSHRSRTAGCSPDARRQEIPDHRRPHPEEHRLRGRPRGAARRR